MTAMNFEQRLTVLRDRVALNPCLLYTSKAPETSEKSSIMDRLKSAKAEKQKDCCPPKKHKGEIEL